MGEAQHRPMNRADMEQAILAGNSVLHNGRLITNVADLPAEEDIAVSVTEKQAALKQLQGERDSLDDRITRLEQDIADQEAEEEANKEGDKAARAARDETAERVRNQRAEHTRRSQQDAAARTGQTHTAEAEATRRRGRGQQAQQASNEPEPEFAGFKLSEFRGKTRKQVVEDYEGVGDATADKIEEALGEHYGEGFAEEADDDT